MYQVSHARPCSPIFRGLLQSSTHFRSTNTLSWLNFDHLKSSIQTACLAGRVRPYSLHKGIKPGSQLTRTQLNGLQVKVQPRMHSYGRSSTNVAGGGKSYLSTAVTVGAGIGAVIAGIYLSEEYDRNRIEREFFNLAFKQNSSIFLEFVSYKFLKNKLFNSVYSGDFEMAKFLIDKGNVDVNIHRIYMTGEDTSVLLEMFHPKTESDLIQFIDFADFVVKRGYKYINRPKYGNKGGDNLLTNIYNLRIFENEPALRRRLLAFFLEKGVDPLYKSQYLGSALSLACFKGDGEFFIDTCVRLKIDLKLKEMSEESAFKLLRGCIINGPRSINALASLVNSGLKVENGKSRLLKELNDWSFRYSPEDFEKAKKIIEASL